MGWQTRHPLFSRRSSPYQPLTALPASGAQDLLRSAPPQHQSTRRVRGKGCLSRSLPALPPYWSWLGGAHQRGLHPHQVGYSALKDQTPAAATALPARLGLAPGLPGSCSCLACARQAVHMALQGSRAFPRAEACRVPSHACCPACLCSCSEPPPTLPSAPPRELPRTAKGPLSPFSPPAQQCGEGALWKGCP